MTKRKINIKKLEEKTITSIIGFEKAYRRHKVFCRKFGRKPQLKEVFLKEYMRKSEPKINAIKAIIQKFNDKRCPILDKQCLEFRRLFSLRQNCINTESFGCRLTIQQWNSFYFHLPSCNSCTAYTMLHKHDSPVATELKEEITQKEFEAGLDEFFKATKPQADSFEEMENREGLKPIFSRINKISFKRIWKKLKRFFTN